MFPRVRTQAFRRPWRIPDDIDRRVAHAGELFEARFDLVADHHMRGTPLSCQGHINGDILLIVGGSIEAHFIDQPKVYDVDRDLRVVALLERVENVNLSERHNKKV